MIRISQLKLPVTHKKSDLEKKIYTTLKNFQLRSSVLAY